MKSRMHCLRSRLSPGLVLLFSLAPLWAATPDADNLIRRSDQAIKPHTTYEKVQMDLYDEQGRLEQSRTLEIYFKQYPDHDVTLQKFLDPPIIQGSGLRIVDQHTAANDIWMYLPTTRRIRRIAGAQKSNHYMGTEFSYEDFEDYQPQSHHFQSLETQDCVRDKRCFRVAATPATEAERQASSYSKKIYWIETESLYPVRVDYVDHQGKTVKRLQVAELAPYGQYILPVQLSMLNLVNKRRTDIRFLERRVDQPLKDYYLSKRYLRTE